MILYLHVRDDPTDAPPGWAAAVASLTEDREGRRVVRTFPESLLAVHPLGSRERAYVRALDWATERGHVVKVVEDGR